MPQHWSATLAELRRLPPLVTSWEILDLREQLAEAAAGRSASSCRAAIAPSASIDCTSARITNTLKVLLQMSLVLVVGAKRPVIRIGRFAGQYAKPRSDGVGDARRRHAAQLPRRHRQPPRIHAGARTPDPQLLLRGYERAAADAEFHPRAGQGRLRRPAPSRVLRPGLGAALAAGRRVPPHGGNHRRWPCVSWKTCWACAPGTADRIDFFTAHEALHLGYESAQTRRVPRRPGWFNLSTHFPWVGLRTNQPEGAHIEYLRGIENPVGVKVGAPVATRDQVARWLDILDPRRARRGGCR